MTAEFYFIAPDGRRSLWERPRNRDELGERFRMFGLVMSPNVHPECEGIHDAPLDVAWSIYSRTDYRTGAPAPYIVLKGSRGLSGKSTLLAGVTSLEGLEGLSSTLVGGSAQQSRRIHEVGSGIWEHNVEYKGQVYERGLARLVEDPTAMETRFFTGAKRRALTASQTSVRGPHQPRTRLDEVDEMDEAIWESVLGQTGLGDFMALDEAPDPNTQTVMSSTHQHANGTFTAVLKRARERGWPIYEYCWRDTLRTEDRYAGPDLWAGTRYGPDIRSPDARPDGKEGGWLPMWLAVEKRLGVSATTWAAEYELGEPSPGDRAIQGAAVKRAFPVYLYRSRAPMQGLEGEYLEFPCCAAYRGTPCRTHPYATGADWAKSIDWTIISTYRTDARHPDTGDPAWMLVAWERMGRRLWPEMHQRLVDRIRRFPGPAAHDATDMGGQMSGDYVALAGVEAIPVGLRGELRKQIFQDYVVALESRQVVSPRIEFAYDEHRFCTIKDLASGPDRRDGHPPDSLVASALAWWCRHRDIGTGYTVTGLDQESVLSGVR